MNYDVDFHSKWIMVIAGSAIAFVFWCFGVANANATDLSWPHSEWTYSSQNHRIKVSGRKKRPAYRNVERGRNYYRADESFELDIDDDKDWRNQGVDCANKVRGVGTQWIGTEGALDAAKKDWMERTRYDLGESYLDLKNARGFVSRCGRVSIGETMGQVMYRCEILARPCKGAMDLTTEAVKK